MRGKNCSVSQPPLDRRPALELGQRPLHAGKDQGVLLFVRIFKFHLEFVVLACRETFSGVMSGSVGNNSRRRPACPSVFSKAGRPRMLVRARVADAHLCTGNGRTIASSCDVNDSVTSGEDSQ